MTKQAKRSIGIVLLWIVVYLWLAIYAVQSVRYLYTASLISILVWLIAGALFGWREYREKRRPATRAMGKFTILVMAVFWPCFAILDIVGWGIRTRYEYKQRKERG